MKYDEMNKLEVNSYPNDNVVKESKRHKQIRIKNPAKAVNAALLVSAIGAGAACATLLSTVISMAVNGQLAYVFQSLM